MKKLLPLFIMTLSSMVYAQLTWVGESASYISVNSGTSQWYNCSTTWASNNFQGYNFSNVLSLKLGGECQSYQTNGDVATLGWEIRDGATTSSNIIYGGTLNLPYLGPSGNNDKWQEINNQVEVINPSLLNPGTTYYLHIWFYVTDNDASTTIYDSNGGSNYVASIATDASLPVELTSFTATAYADAVKLSWTTASEINNQGYAVLRSHEKQGKYSELDSYLTESSLRGAGTVSHANEYEYTDHSVLPGTTYFYKLVDIDVNGLRTEHGPIRVSTLASGQPLQPIAGLPPEDFSISQNYPNPFNPSTRFTLSIPKMDLDELQVTVDIYNLSGKKVATLFNGKIGPGTYELHWNGLNESGITVPSGIYIYNLRSQLFNKARRMVLLR